MNVLLTNLLLQAVEIYSYILLIWVIGSWFPRFTITKFYKFIDKIVFPYAQIFRSFIPPFGGFDFSVIAAFIVLQYILPQVIIRISSLFIMPGA
jgi:YggT family protein